MATSVLLDTNIIVDRLRNVEQAKIYLSELPAVPTISAVTVAELYAGVREGKERRELDRFLARLNILPLDETIAVQAGLFRRQFGPSHNVGLMDALIAATSCRSGLRLATLNARHFPMLKNLIIPYTPA